MTLTLTRLEADVKSYLSCTEAQAVALCDELEAYGIKTFEDFERRILLSDRFLAS